MANLLEVLGVSPDDMGSVPQDVKDASSLLEGMQDIYEEMPISKRKEEFANVISEGVKQLLIRLGALTRLSVQSTQNIQQQLPSSLDDLIPLDQAQGAIIPSGTKALRIFTDENLGKQNANLLNIAPIEIIQHTTNVPISQIPIKHFEERGYIVKTKDVTQLYETSEAGNIQSYERIDFVVEGDIVLLESLKGDKLLGEVKFDNTINEWYIEVTSGSTKWAKFKQDYLFSSQNTNPSVKLYEGVKSFSKTSTTPTPPQTSTPKPPTPPTSTPPPPTSTPTPPTPPPSKPTKPSKPTPPPTSTPPTPPPSDDEPKQMTKSEIEDAIKGLNILAKLGDKDAKASIKGLKVLLKYA